MQTEEKRGGATRWESVKQSLALVAAIFLSTMFAVALSEGVQQASTAVSRSVFW